MNMDFRIDGGRRRAYAAGAGLVLLAWVVLLAWGASPYAPWLDHAEMEHVAALTSAPAAVRLGVFALGWALMVLAMMLPGTLLLLDHCWGDRPLRRRSLLPLLLAYVAVWTVFGVLCYWGDGQLHELVEEAPALGGFIAPAVLLLAGGYQLTPWKRACLARCRPEGAAYLAHQPTPGAGAAAALGVRHGLYCLGSGWALMLLMFAAGGVDLLWMLLLALAMTAERVLPRGVQWAQGLGLLLIGGGTVQMATFLWGQFAVG